MAILESLRSALARRSVVSYSVQELLYRLALQDEISHLVRRDRGPVPCVWVTDLVGCSNRYHLARRYPELKIQLNYSPLLVMGRVLHIGLERILEEKWPGVQLEKPVEKTISLDDGRIVKITGMIDAYIPEEGLIIEFKTSRADHDLPLQHHVLQLQIYMNMLRAERGLLFYINPDRIAEYPVTKPIDDWQLQQLVQETLNNEKHPRWGDWECSYCIFNIMCPFKKQNNWWRR